MGVYPTPFVVTHVTRAKTGENALGQPIYAETSTVRKVYGWAPTYETERHEAALAGRTVSDLTLYTPDLDWSSNDKVVVDGLDYEVIGNPKDFNHGPFGFQPGCTVNLKRVSNVET